MAVHVADSAGLTERTTACQLLLALAKLDADAVWLLLFRLQVRGSRMPFIALVIAGAHVLSIA